MAFVSSNKLLSFFQTETPNVTSTILRAERIAVIRARRIAIKEAQVQLNQQIEDLNQNHNLARPAPGG